MDKNKLLVWASAASGIAALLHIACIGIGAEAYRFLGAGEQLAQMAEQGHWYPTAITLMISTVLIVFSVYAASGAGLLPKVPLLKFGLLSISCIYLFRAFGVVLLVPMFPENSLTFWLVTSSICLVIGLLYGLGAYKLIRA